ncbi:hypothetical protein ACFQ4C_00450 [Larkinella insperata]|uniref:Uncharacterized protein n=1 Tax=Larkinella insperata TaxID=332158 RepID=A0ABW3PWT1_9BACT|nr:hypothetical protein [Larkinella insperata]
MTAQLDIRDLAQVIGFRVVYRSDSSGWRLALLMGLHTGEEDHPDQDRAYISFPDPIDGVSGDWIPIDQIVPFLRPLTRLLKEDAREVLKLVQYSNAPLGLEEGKMEISVYREEQTGRESGVQIAFSPASGQAVELFIRKDLQIKWRHDGSYTTPYNLVDLVDLLSKKGYDVRGWIEKGLALDLTQPGQDSVPK